MKLTTEEVGQGNGMRQSEVIVGSTSGNCQYSFRRETSWLTGTSRALRGELRLTRREEGKGQLERLGTNSWCRYCEEQPFLDACFWSMAMEREMDKGFEGGGLFPWQPRLQLAVGRGGGGGLVCRITGVGAICIVW